MLNSQFYVFRKQALPHLHSCSKPWQARTDYDLEYFLCHERPLPFTDEVTFRALFGLSSAINLVYNYFFEEFDLKLTGCHYDLKPRNILVRGNDFVISDFGLSRMKSLEESSASAFKGGVSDYTAPECQSLNTDFSKNRIRRSSDIWSLGCILAKIATFIQDGQQGVEAFSTQRRVTMGVLTLKTFHAGNQPSVNVAKWIEKLVAQASTHPHRSTHLQLIRRMLNFEASARPTSRQTLADTFLITARLSFNSISKSLAQTLYHADISKRIEHERLKCWAHVVGLVPETRSRVLAKPWILETGSESHFEDVLSLMRDIRLDLERELELLMSGGQGLTTSAYDRTLRNRVDRLWALLPFGFRRTMNDEMDALYHAELDSEFCVPTEQLTILGVDTSYERVRLTTAMKQAMSALETSAELHKEILIEKSALCVTQRPTPQGKGMGYIELSDSRKTSVVIEHMVYSDAWMDRSEALLSRMSGLVAILSNMATVSDILPILHCVGVTHLPEMQSFTLLFQVPEHSIERTQTSVPLNL